MQSAENPSTVVSPYGAHGTSGAGTKWITGQSSQIRKVKYHSYYNLGIESLADGLW